MNRKFISGGAFAAVAAIVAASSFISCSSDDEYYENGNYTLANRRMTRSGIEGGLSVVPPPIIHSFTAIFTFKHLAKPDSTITRSASGTVTIEFDSVGFISDRAIFSWTSDDDITIINEGAAYHDSHLYISAQAAYNENNQFSNASWNEIVTK